MGIVGLYSTGYGEILEVDESLVAQYVALGWLPITGGGGGGGVTDSAVAQQVTSGAQTKGALDAAYAATLLTASAATSAATLVADKHTPVDATSGALTMTLPTPTRIGQQIRVEKVDASANAVTVSGTLRGATGTVTLPWQYEVITFVAESLSSWRVASGNKTKAALDAAYQQARTAGRRAVATRPAEQGFSLERVGHTGQPFLTIGTQNVVAGKSASTSFYWPFLIHARSTIGPSALDEWYLLHSTDHDAAQGGIWLSTAPSWKGPWTGRGQVYVDTTSGKQTETGTAVWLPGEQLFGLLYQQEGVSGAVGLQTTCLATSPTLLAGSFTRVGPVIDIQPQGAMPGTGHTGYASVHSDGGVFYAHHLMGGGNPSLAGMSQSADFRTWWTDTRPLQWAFDQIDGALRLPWGGVQVVRWRGVLWVIGTLTNGASGTDPRISKVFSARLAEDRRHIIGRPTFHLAPIGSETVNLRSLNATVTPDGELVVIYQCDDAFYLAQAA